MLDAPARRLTAPALEVVAARLDRAQVPPVALTAAGWVVGIGACVAVSQRAWLVGLALWLLNRLLDGLDGPVARIRGATDLGGFLDIVADFSIYAGFVLGVAIAVPEARLACVALLTAYYLSGTAFLALSSILERRGGDEDVADGRSLLFVGGLAEGTETVIAYVAFCLLPHWAEGIAWVFAAAVAITALQRVGLGLQVLRQPSEPRPTDDTTADLEPR